MMSAGHSRGGPTWFSWLPQPWTREVAPGLCYELHLPDALVPSNCVLQYQCGFQEVVTLEKLSFVFAVIKLSQRPSKLTAHPLAC